MDLLKRYAIMVTASIFLTGCLSAGSFFYVFLPSEQVFTPATLSSGKVVGKSEAGFFFGRFATLTVWDFEAGRIKEYFVPVDDYVRIREGDVIGFRHRGRFIVVVQTVDQL